MALTVSISVPRSHSGETGLQLKDPHVPRGFSEVNTASVIDRQAKWS